VLVGLTWLIQPLVLMTLIKNLGRRSLPPLNRISSRDSKVKDEVGGFSNRDVTHEIQLALLHLKTCLLAGFAISGSGVLLLLLRFLLSGVRALISIMPWLSTIVANAGRKFFRLGHLLLILLVLEISRRLVLE
jgi:hypothetical protein